MLKQTVLTNGGSLVALCFLLGNLAPVNPPNFAQLNFGYRITGKDVVSLELITWKTAWPIGINPFFNKAYGTPKEQFPGYIRDYGLSVAYQRFFFGKAYTPRFM